MLEQSLLRLKLAGVLNFSIADLYLLFQEDEVIFVSATNWLQLKIINGEYIIVKCSDKSFLAKGSSEKEFDYLKSGKYHKTKFNNKPLSFRAYNYQSLDNPISLNSKCFKVFLWKSPFSVINICIDYIESETPFNLIVGNFELCYDLYGNFVYFTVYDLDIFFRGYNNV